MTSYQSENINSLSGSNQGAPIYNLNTMWEEQLSIEQLTSLDTKLNGQTFKNLDKWRGISRSIQQITQMNEKATQSDMRSVVEFYQLLNHNNKLNDENKNNWRVVYLKDDRLCEYFLNTFAFEVVKNIIEEKYFHFVDTLELANQILIQSVQLFITTFESTTPAMTYMLAYIFDNRKSYFNINNKITSPFYVQQLYGLGDGIRNWLNQVKVGDEVDAIKIDKYKSKSCWSRAIIHKIDGAYFFLRFVNSSIYYDRSVWKEGFEVRPKGSRVPESEMNWRYELKPEDLVDCCDTASVFYNSTVLKVRDHVDSHDRPPVKQVYIGYRVYSNEGFRSDDRGKFNGWTSNYDEWLDVTDPRIQRYNTIAKKFYSKASTANYDEHIDDFSDLVQLLEDENGMVLEGQIKEKAFEEYRAEIRVEKITNVKQDEIDHGSEQEEQENEQEEEQEEEDNSLQNREENQQQNQLSKEQVNELEYQGKEPTLEGDDEAKTLLQNDQNEAVAENEDTNSEHSVNLDSFSGHRIYASPKKNACLSLFQMAAIAKFGELGGFKLILQKIQQKTEDQWCGIDILVGFMHIFSAMQYQLSKRFAEEYAKEMIPAIIHNILQSPGSNLRNFTKDKIDIVNIGLSGFILRVYSIGQKLEMIEKFNLKIALQSFNSEYIKTQLQGLKTIMELISQLRSERTADSLQADELKSWIEENEIFNRLFKSDKYQLIAKAADFFKFMLSENMIDEQHLELLWAQTRKHDMELKLAIYTILKDNFHSQSFDKPIIKFFILKIANCGVQEIGVEDIDLVQSFTRFRNKGSEFVEIVREVYQRLVENGQDIQNDVLEEAIKAFCDSYSFDVGKESFLKVFEKYVSEIDKGSASTLSVLKIISKLLEGLFPKSSFNDSFSRQDAAQYLFIEKQIVHVVVNNIRQLKEKLVAQIKSQNNDNNTGNIQDQQIYEESELDTYFVRSSYVDQIQQRVDFLSFIYSNLPDKIELTIEVISEVWDAVVVEGLIPRERDILYQWFSEMTTGSASSQQRIKKEDLQLFFEKKLCAEDDLMNMTLNGFNCFKSVFSQLNEKDNKMKKVPQEKVATYPPTNYSYMNCNFNTCSPIDTRTNLDFYYMMLDVPTNLKGIDSLWQLITLNQDDQVIEKALEFLNNLHTNFESSVVVETEETIKRRYYKQAYEYLEKQVTESGDSEKIKRCIMIMESILDESEKKGNGGLKSLMCMSKGELITLHFATTFYSADLPGTFSFKIYSNDTVLDLLYKVGLHVRSTYEEVQLTIADSRRVIEAKENGKSIAELRFKNGERLLVSQIKGSPVKEQDLIVEGKVCETAIGIFKKWFRQFQIDGQMKPLQVAQFINSCTNDNCLEGDARVVGCMEQYDKEKKGYLNEANFITFYTTACQSKPDVVRRNLATYGYRRDLKRYDEVTVESIDVTSMPRYILARDQKFFSMVFELLSREDVGAVAWRFLSRLPISPALYEKIVKLEGIRDAKNGGNWDSLLGGKCKYTLLYNLHAMEYLMEEGESEQSSQVLIGQTSKELEELKKSWRSDFIRLGGFDHLSQRFQKLLSEDISELDSFQKYILSFILKIFKNYLVAAFQTTKPWMYRTIGRMGMNQVSLSNLVLSMRRETFDGLRLRRKESELQEKLIQNELNRGDSSIPHTNKSIANSTGDIGKFEESEEFLSLVGSLIEQNLTQHILQKFQFKQLFRQLLELSLSYLTSDKELESEDRVIIEYALLILSTIVVADSDAAKELLFTEKLGDEETILEKLLKRGLFYKGSQNIRRVINHCFFMMSQSFLKESQDDLPARNLLQILMGNIPGLHNNYENCAQYFELFCALLDSLAYHQIDTNTQHSWVDFDVLLNSLVQGIKARQSTETRINPKSDKILVGLINLADRILAFKEDLKVKIGSREGADLVLEIFHKCLFDISNFHEIDQEEIKKYDKLVVKCKADASRAAAFRLLVTLCKNCPENLNILMQNGLQRLIQMLPTSKGSTDLWMRESRSDNGHVGLRNLGCICYMNAMVQQFFMTPTFRFALLMADDKIPPNVVSATYNKKKITTDDNVLHQFQQLFSYLQMSDRMDYNPIEFCFSFKDYNNEPVNTIVQQDAQEFLNMIFDKIENGLKGTPFKRLLECVYGGKTQSQLVCSNCKVVTNKYEQFYNISLEVKNSHSIFESFEKFIAGETISDFKCESCSKKVDVTKRVSLKELPNVLVIHLQRIIFDIESLMNVKLNSRLEFPREINLQQFTSEYLDEQELMKEENSGSNNGEDEEEEEEEEEEENENDDDEENEDGNEDQDLKEIKHKKKNSTKEDDILVDDNIDSKDDPNSPTENTTDNPKINQEKSKLTKKDFEYRLAGVVVHTGTAEYGHYYSFIDTQRSSIRDSTKDAWLEFNDSRVKEFSTKDIENECFGGKESESDDTINFGWMKRDNSTNAYILVYEKIVKQPIELVFTSQEEQDQILPTLPIFNYVQKPAAEDNPERRIQVDYDEINEYVPNGLFKTVWTDNHQFMLEKHIMHDSFYNFIKDITNSIDLPQTGNKDIKELSMVVSDPKQKLAFTQLLDMHTDIITEFLNKKIIMDEMVDRMVLLMKLLPEKCLDIFNKYFLKDFVEKEALIIKSTDNHTRAFLAKMYSHCSEIIIQFYGINFDSMSSSTPNGDEDQNALSAKKTMKTFLDTMIEYLGLHASEYWFKNEQYFKFWESFSEQGSCQLKYMLDHGMLSKFLDYFLGEDSPLSTRKEYMSSRAICPKYTEVVRTIANLLEHTETMNERISRVCESNLNSELPSTIAILPCQQLSEINQDVFKCIYTTSFWEKIFSCKSIDNNVIKRITERLTRNNEHLSYLAAEAIIRSLVRVNSDEVKTLCVAISSLLSIEDELFESRIETLLGVVMVLPNLSNSKNNGKDLLITEYGTYGQSCIGDATVQIKSSLQLEHAQSVCEAIYSNRKISEHVSIQLLIVVLNLAIENQRIREYVARLPSPSYLFSSYLNFIQAFLDEYYQDSITQKYPLFPRLEHSQIAIQAHNVLKEALIKDKEQQQGNNLEGFSNYQLYTIGKTRNSKVIRTAELKLLDKYFESEDVQDFSDPCFKTQADEEAAFEKVQLAVNRLAEQSKERAMIFERDLNTYITDSNPAVTSNIALDPSIVKDTYIMTACMNAMSPWHAFFRSRYPTSYGLYSNQQIDLQEQKKAMEREFKNKETVREYIVDNPTMNAIDLKITFIPTDLSNPNQQMFPREAKYCRVKPRSMEVIFALTKKSLEHEWGEFDVKVDYTVYFRSDIKSQLKLQILESQYVLAASTLSSTDPMELKDLKVMKRLAHLCHIASASLVQSQEDQNEEKVDKNEGEGETKEETKDQGNLLEEGEYIDNCKVKANNLKEKLGFSLVDMKADHSDISQDEERDDFISEI